MYRYITSPADLAIFTGRPTFSEKLHVGRPNIGNRQRLLARINQMLDRKWLTNDGPLASEFERRIADMIGVKHAIAMCNATVALEIAIRALGLTGEVIVPSFTFIATAHALQWQEITPVFCDVDPRSHNLDPTKLERMITPRTSGIIGVHVWGRPCAIESLAEIAARHHLKLLYDAAHAFACSYKGKMIGNFGDAEVFSFHATKFCNAFEGGAVVTHNDELAAKIRLMKNFGFTGKLDDVGYVGTNGKMNEASAAMGLTSLESLEHFIVTNYRNYQQYQQELAAIPGLRLIHYNEANDTLPSEANDTLPAEGNQYNYQYIVAEIDQALTGISRDDIVKVLLAENILARRYFYPGCHQMEPYRSYFPHAGLLLPETEKLTQQVISLPNGTAVGADEITTLCQIIRLLIANGPEISARISGI